MVLCFFNLIRKELVFSLLRLSCVRENEISFELFCRDLWKLSAWGQAESPQMPRAWRASMGILCGNLDAALLQCRSWEDLLWAHLKVFVDLRVEEEIRDNVIGRRYIPMPDKYWNQK